MWHVETDFFALCIFFVMLFRNRASGGQKKNRQDRAFFVVLLVSICGALIDIVSSLAMNGLGGYWFYQISMTVFCAFLPAMSVVWMCYMMIVISKKPWKQVRRVIGLAMVPYVIYFCVACTNPVNSLFFHLTPEMEYTRGPLFLPIGIGFLVMYSVVGIAILIIQYKKITPKYNVYLLACFFIVSIIAVFVQLANPGWLIIDAAYALVYVLCDATVEEERRQALYSEIRAQNKSLEEAVNKEKAASRAKTEFLSRISHDIRTPISIISNMTDFAIEDRAQENKLIQDLNKIKTANTFLLSLINDVLDISKIDSGKVELLMEPYPFEEYLASITSILEPLCMQKGIQFEIIGEVPKAVALADKVRLNQITFNLLSNAVKYTQAGGSVRYRYRWEIRDQEGKEKIQYTFTIEDTGIGMSREFQKVMFEPFTQDQENKLRNRAEQGTGLGLSIVKKLVDLMEGQVTVLSRVGEGSRITVTLPLEIDKRDKIFKKDQEENRLEKKLTGKVLLVEDQAVNREIAIRILENMGLQVIVAENGSEAVQTMMKAVDGEYQVILMDIQMPIMNGYEATEKIRNLDSQSVKEIPIIALTADAFSDAAARGKKAGMTEYLTKPIDPEKLRLLMEKTIAG